VTKYSFFRTIKHLFKLIEGRYHHKFLVIQLLIIVSGAIETVSFFSVLPLVNLISNPDVINSGMGLYLYQLSGLKTIEDFTLTAGIIVLISILISSLLSIARVWFTTLFANEVGFRVGDNLFLNYLNKDYEFHIFRNSSYLTKQVTVEAIRLKNMIKAFMQLNSDIFMVTVIVTGMIIYNAKSTIILMFFIGLIYFILHMRIGGLLLNNGRVLSVAVKERFKVITNSFGGISDIIISDNSDYFNSKMQDTGRILAYTTTINQVVAQAPAKIFQALILGGLVSIILYYATLKNDDMGTVILTLSAFIMAGYKTMPMFQSIYESLSNIKSNSPAIEVILSDFNDDEKFTDEIYDDKTKIEISGDIVFSEVSYRYPGQKKPTINKFNAVFKKGTIVGIMGESGSGKTTIIKLIASLIYPTTGSISVGDMNIDVNNSQFWRNTIGVISQDIFLIDGTIAENIAFGKHRHEINISKVRDCVRRAHLEEHIKGLPHGLETNVGERGVQLSGGQKQRIGIARAMYHDRRHLIMDEATSALDKITEQRIIKEIVSGDKGITIIMIAHRIDTLTNCDLIYIVDNGAVVEKGSYRDLMVKSSFFKKMSGSHE